MNGIICRSMEIVHRYRPCNLILFPELPKSDINPSAYLDALGIYEATVVRKEGCHKKTDVVGLAEPAQGRRIGNLLTVTLVAFSAAKLGVDGSRRDGIDANPPLSIFFCEIPCQSFQRGFECPIDGDPGKCEAGKPGGDVNDLAVICH